MLRTSEENPVVTSKTNNIINISNLGKRSSSNVNKPLRRRYFYTRYQDLEMFEIGIASATFTKIPRLSLAAHHSVPTIYKIRVQMTAQPGKQGVYSLVQFLINNQVLISNQLLPNNDKCLKHQHVCESSIMALDFRGGSFFGSGSTTSVCAPYFKSAFALMAAGS
ncbi:unnamed protein product [Rotaria socialis]|uniref:Uncharacterized protein n=1 Tax=Rotaria socialis TaxID=392032 RepID=A0A818L9G6_9BILA|nr:unnamed protein product [Rotaria socialis]